MKNLIKITSALRVLLVCGFLFSASFLKAQNCNVTINNNLGCDVQLDIHFFESIPPCTACPGNPINITIIMGGSTLINCSDPALWSCTAGLSICNISATFTSPITAGPFFFSTVPQFLTLPSSCLATAGANIVFSAGTIDINP